MSEEDTITVPRSDFIQLTQQVQALASRVSEKCSFRDEGPPATKLSDPTLLNQIPKYNGLPDQSIALWESHVESFVQTFNVSIKAIEPHLSKLLQGKALAGYNQLRNDLKKSKGLRYPSWKETIQHLEKFDDSITRSLKIHQQILQLKHQSLTLNDTVEQFRKLERNLDSGPFGDRLFLLFQTIPFSRDIVLKHMDRVASIDDACDLILELESKSIYCKHCFKSNHPSDKCFKLKQN
ncbi:hypothetical protein TRICI_006810 [Trichomonascus ciferrii]|uniref:Uncharacterized protein n=1 Tax=Trichomonascus ciferrii TaxID=44093 RepID=A0A642UDB7_9ASCO|nr:hypothetical protein TRICI_006810 [Trichomonascus ciferrii]